MPRPTPWCLNSAVKSFSTVWAQLVGKLTPELTRACAQLARGARGHAQERCGTRSSADVVATSGCSTQAAAPSPQRSTKAPSPRVASGDGMGRTTA